MVSSIKKFLCLLLFIVAPLAYAQSATESLTDMLSKINTIEADFQQTLTDSASRVLQQSYGHMALQRPGKFRWEITQPVPQLIITNGQRLWIYDPDLRQVTIRSLTKAAGEAPALLLTGSVNNLEKEFRIEAIHYRGSDLQWFVLYPRDNSSIFAYVQLGFDQNSIRQMLLQTHLGQTTRVYFKHIKTVANLSPSLFIFHPPANVDVINEGR